jgi:hypothetical protein
MAVSIVGHHDVLGENGTATDHSRGARQEGKKVPFHRVTL